jgi:hypothetical protein
VTPFFAFPDDVRKIVYTTNAVESLHMSLRRVIKTRGSFPTEEAAIKLLYLALSKVVAKWETVQNWKMMPANRELRARSKFPSNPGFRRTFKSPCSSIPPTPVSGKRNIASRTFTAPNLTPLSSRSRQTTPSSRTRPTK